MTKDDGLFDIKYMKFDADEAQGLIGKNVFVSSSLFNLRNAVNAMDVDNPNYYGQLISAKQPTQHEAAFRINCDNREFMYVYYDPYYELKCAFKHGETLEYRLSADCWCIATHPSFDDKPECYRIKQNKSAPLKWQDLKIGDFIRGPLMKGIKYETSNDYYGMVTLIDTDKGTNAHICLGNQWVSDEIICEFRRVDRCGEDIE